MPPGLGEHRKWPRAGIWVSSSSSSVIEMIFLMTYEKPPPFHTSLLLRLHVCVRARVCMIVGIIHYHTLSENNIVTFS